MTSAAAMKEMEAVERKLRPVYDAIDCGNMKLALKSITAVVQKHPESDIAAALRAVVLQRSGKTEEALAAADQVASRTPTDEHVLQTLGLVWRATGRTTVREHTLHSTEVSALRIWLTGALFSTRVGGAFCLRGCSSQSPWRSRLVRLALLRVCA